MRCMTEGYAARGLSEYKGCLIYRMEESISLRYDNILILPFLFGLKMAPLIVLHELT